MNEHPHYFPCDLSADSLDSTELIKNINEKVTINEFLPGLVKTEPTALLLDINNLYKQAQRSNFRIDYKKLKNLFQERCDLRYCAAFSAIDRNNPDTISWVNYMIHTGYQIITKDISKYVNSKGDLITKGNMDIEIALKAVRLSPGFAHIIIATCDGDFVPVIEDLREGEFRKVSVLGITNSDSVGMSKTLADTADYFYDIDNLKDQIAYVRKT